MGYCSKADMIAQFGERALLDTTDRGDETADTIDDAAIERAIASADAMIDGYLKVRYALPLTATPAIVNKLSMTIAFYELHVLDVGPKVQRDHDNALKLLSQISKGDVKLDAAGVEPASAGTSGARITDRDRPMTEDNMKGWF